MISPPVTTRSTSLVEIILAGRAICLIACGRKRSFLRAASLIASRISFTQCVFYPGAASRPTPEYRGNDQIHGLGRPAPAVCIRAPELHGGRVAYARSGYAGFEGGISRCCTSPPD